MRQIILDTETTGLSPDQGHRIIEIGCVELINRRVSGKTFHTYLHPEREVDEGAVRVHGITTQFLKDKPKFIEISKAFKNFIQGAELIIHNAPFDVGFIENEFKLIQEATWESLTAHCTIVDTLSMARSKHPGQRNNLDALCKRYNIDNKHRDKHGALLDATILCDVYLAMTGGQHSLAFESASPENTIQKQRSELTHPATSQTPGILITEAELTQHAQFIEMMEKKAGKKSLWAALEEN